MVLTKSARFFSWLDGRAFVLDAAQARGAGYFVALDSSEFRLQADYEENGAA